MHRMYSAIGLPRYFNFASITILKAIVFLLLFWLSFTPLHGQVGSQTLPTLSLESAKQDFLVFRDSLMKIHPAIDRYQNKQIINHQFDSCYATLSNSILEIELYKKFKFLLSSVDDGHLWISQTGKASTYTDTKAQIFPLRLYFTADKSYSICENSSQIRTGAEITAINGVSINEIKEKLFQYIVADGSITTKKRWVLNRYFWFYYYLVYGECKTFKVQIRQNGKNEVIVVAPSIFKESSCLKQLDEMPENLSLTFKPQGIALLTIKTFNQNDFENKKENYSAFLEKSFADIKRRHIKCLLIDVRHNGGGKDIYGSLLYSYLAAKPFPYYESLETKNGVLPQKSHANLSIQTPSKDNFLGKVIFLIDGLTFSTAAEFCSIAKSNKRGLFVGEETGGGYYGNNSGSFVDVVLPNTKLIVSIPTIKYTMDVRASTDKARGIRPDIQLLPTIADILRKEDAQLNFAISLAGKK